MRYERRVLILFCVVLVAAVTSTTPAGSSRTVCASGCEFTTLQKAVDLSEWGATIELGPEVYFENVVVRGALTIRGAGADRTVVDGGPQGAALRLEGPLAYQVRLEDLTIRSGDRGWISSGAGVVSLERCMVREAVSDSPRFRSRDATRQTDAVIPARAGAARRSEHGIDSTAPSVSSTGEQSTGAAVYGDPSGGGPAEAASTSAASDAGVTLCHNPPGNRENARTIVVGQTAVSAHLEHGDSAGACPRFTYNDDGTVTDQQTGLIWLWNARCLGTATWAWAQYKVNRLADGECGLSDGSVAGDWRLPTIKELQSLVDYSQSSPALPEGSPFLLDTRFPYWSNTSYALYSTHAWMVSFYDGAVIIAEKTSGREVWPVRGGQ
jgi:hypothetical protein